jgi:hypothetical protein
VLLLLCIVSGAVLLWRRTKRIAALAQLVAAAAFCLCLLVDWLREFNTPFDASAISNLLWSPRVTEIGGIIMIVSSVIFPIAYLCHAITRKRI